MHTSNLFYTFIIFLHLFFIYSNSVIFFSRMAGWPGIIAGSGWVIYWKQLDMRKFGCHWQGMVNPVRSPLLLSATINGARFNKRWHIYVNTKVEWKQCYTEKDFRFCH